MKTCDTNKEGVEHNEQLVVRHGNMTAETIKRMKAEAARERSSDLKVRWQGVKQRCLRFVSFIHCFDSLLTLPAEFAS